LLEVPAKEPGRRYESAAALADELERWLHGEPIRARPSGVWEQAVKWVKRQPAVTAFFALSVVASLIAVAALYGANAAVVVGALWVLWLGVALYVLRRQALRREAPDPAGEQGESILVVFRRQPQRVRLVVLVFCVWSPFCALIGCVGLSMELVVGEIAAFVARVIGVFLLGGLLFYLLRVRNPGDQTAIRPSSTHWSEWDIGTLWGRFNRRLLFLRRPLQTQHRVRALRHAKRAAKERARTCQAFTESPQSRFARPNLFLVLMGALGGFFFVILSFFRLFSMEFLSRETFLLIGLVGATIGALLIAVHQALRLHQGDYSCYAMILVLGNPGAMSLWQEQDWALARSWGWIWVAISSVVFVAMMVAVLVNLVMLRMKPAHVGTDHDPVDRSSITWAAIIVVGCGGLLFMVGPMALASSCAILVGQAGLMLDGDGGIEIGEALGAAAALLGMLGGVTIILNRLNKASHVSDGLFMLKKYLGFLAIAFVVLTDGAVLCLFLRNGTHPVEVHRVQPNTTMNSAAEQLGIALAREGRRLLFVDANGTRQVSDRARLEELARQGLPIGSFTCAVLSTDGRQMLSGDMKCSVRVWDLENGSQLEHCRGHRSWITSVSFSADGRRAVSGSLDRTVRLWDLDSGRQLCVFRGHTDVIHNVAFSADGKSVLSASRDATVRVWQIPE
jgi:Ca2+/Na+ antiporter